MNRWIEETDCDPIKTFLRHSKICVIVSKVDGSILWANQAFCEWSNYTLSELLALGWKRISVNDESLEADLVQTQSLDGYLQSYQVTKQYIPKNKKPAWGVLSVWRWPASGPCEFCVCTWEPLKNGTQTAFNLAMAKLEEFGKEIQQVSAEVKSFSERSDEDRLVSSAITVAKKHPKVTATLFLAFLSTVGANNVIQILSRFNLLPIPPNKVEVVEQPK